MAMLRLRASTMPAPAMVVAKGARGLGDGPGHGDRLRAVGGRVDGEGQSAQGEDRQ
jgi:hypothetical protein